MLYIFDVGNVLLKCIDVNRQMAEMLGIDEKELYAQLCAYDFPIMDGTVSIREYYNHIERQFNVRIDGDPWYDFFRPVLNNSIADAITELRKMGYTVVSGTNNCDPHWRYIKEHGFDRFFERNYVSHLIGISKPSRQFFEYILRHEGVCPSDAVFVDDYEENIAEASSIGINTIHYTADFDNSNLMERLLEFSKS